MASARLADLRMTADSRSYVDALHAILTHKGWTALSKPMLSGMTATGFRFTVNRRLTAESPTAYNWMAENFLAADFLGLTTSQHAGFTFQPTFPLYRDQIISEIKSSIDRGMGAVFWHDGFVVAAGYDDEIESLFYSDGVADDHCVLPYEDFGSGMSPYWYYQVIEDRMEMDSAAIIKESFLQAIYKWETHDLMLPRDVYACGREAYDAIIEALRSGDYDREGVRHTFACYAAAKRDLAAYTASVKEDWPQAGEAAAQYRRLAALFEFIDEPGRPTPDELIGLFLEARRTEEHAVRALRELVRETADNRFHDIGLR